MIHALFLLLLVPSILCSAGCNDRRQRSGEQASAQAAPASPVSLRFDSAALSARITAIETAIEGSRRKLNVPGASVAIVLDDRPILLSGFGVRDLRSGAPVTPKTLFSIGSCTKPFTALATLIAAEEGRLSLDGSPKNSFPILCSAIPRRTAPSPFGICSAIAPGCPTTSPRVGSSATRPMRL